MSMSWRMVRDNIDKMPESILDSDAAILVQDEDGTVVYMIKRIGAIPEQVANDLNLPAEDPAAFAFPL